MRFLSRWLGGSQPPARKPVPTFKPVLESLTERVNPHGGFGLSNLEAFGGLFGRPDAGSEAEDVTATEFRVSVQRSVFGGSEARVRVTAVDENGRIDTDYTGSVTLTSSDGTAVLPEVYTFVEGDFGRQTLLVTLNGSGEQTLTATDADGLTGEVTVDVKDAPVVSSLFVQVQAGASVGEPTRVLVAALDEANRLVPTYTGTVSISTSDDGAAVPEDYTFTASDRGVKVLTVTPAAAGELTITATDTANGELTASATTTVGEARTVESLVVIARPVAEAGDTVRVLVAAVDENGRPVGSYDGTVTLTSSDADATLPDAYTFTADDNGVKVFELTLTGAGSQTITATDADGELVGEATVTVIEPRSDSPFEGNGDRLFGGRGHGFGRPRGGFGIF